MPDIFGLIAPRPLLLDMGIYDDNFTISEMLEGAGRARAMYAAAGSPGALQTDVHPHGHAFGGDQGGGLLSGRAIKGGATDGSL